MVIVSFMLGGRSKHVVLGVECGGQMTQIKKRNRRSGPARVTQKGTSKRYPHPNHAGLQRKQNRYYNENIGPVVSMDRTSAS